MGLFAVTVSCSADTTESLMPEATDASVAVSDATPASDPDFGVMESPEITRLEVSVGIEHDRLGNLVLKLVPPPDTATAAITLQSRAGYNESADDGRGRDNGTTAGEYSDLSAQFPIVYSNTPSGLLARDWISSEFMGLDGVGNMDNVCESGTNNICVFKPSQGRWQNGEDSLERFNGFDPRGLWRLCVGDADGWSPSRNGPGEGKLHSFALRVTTASGTRVATATTAAPVDIPDDDYDGTIGSMACLDVMFSFDVPIRAGPDASMQDAGTPLDAGGAERD